jgi:hypothetical protein
MNPALLFRGEGLKPRPLGRNEWADPRNNALATLQEGMLDELRWEVCPVVHNSVWRHLADGLRFWGWGEKFAGADDKAVGGGA